MSSKTYFSHQILFFKTMLIVEKMTYILKASFSLERKKINTTYLRCLLSVLDLPSSITEKYCQFHCLKIVFWGKCFSCDLCSHLIHISTWKLLKEEIGIFSFNHTLRQSSFRCDGQQNRNGDSRLLGSYAGDLMNLSIVSYKLTCRPAHKAGIAAAQSPIDRAPGEQSRAQEPIP